MSLGRLDVLNVHREALLLAEAGTLIHNIGKLSSEFVRKQGGDSACKDFDHEPITGIIVDYVRASSFPLSGKDRDKIRSLCNHAQQSLTSSLVEAPFKDWIKSILIALPGPLNDRTYTLADFIDLQSQRLYPDQIQLLFSSGSRLTWLGARAHGESSGLEKQESLLDNTFKQDPGNTWIESVFGAPISKIGLTQIERLRKRVLCFFKLAISTDLLRNRSRLLRVWRRLEAGLGDTRRPANDVTLWDFNYSAACLLKPALVTVLLDGWRHPDQLCWRLLRVNFNVLGLYAKAIKIADLLSYQHIIDKACERVKQLVEEEYPLGNEVYRDTTGIYFTFPDLPLPAELLQEIRRRVEEADLELAPRIAVTKGDGSTAIEQLKGILAKAHGEARNVLAQPFDCQNLNLEHWQKEWRQAVDSKSELCPVCRLRPTQERAEACGTCSGRRGSRIETWRKDPHRTIWMDELADHNGRVALIVGRFGLDDWLSGDLVQTMLVRCKPDDSDPDKRFVPKNPSPARLRRVWETCRRFWTDTVEKGILERHEYGKDTKRADLRYIRWLVVPDRQDVWKENVPYDGTVNGKPISLLWRKDEKKFVTIINMQLTSELQQGQTIIVSDPDDSRKKITIMVQAVEQPDNGMEHYTPFLPLPASPDRFLALVPTADAMEIAKKIQMEYTRQFGKVQNRLPLFLGLVFFQRKTPLLAVMDAARKMLDVRLDFADWTVADMKTETEQWMVNGNRVNQEIHILKLERDTQKITMRVPTKMGDGQTPDIWYPYWRVEGKPTDREFFFSGPDHEHWVYVKNLRVGDKVKVTPSHFAYLFLEHTAQRFRFDPPNDILLLDELRRLAEMWNTLKTKTPEMTDTKLQGIQALFDAKWRLWRLDEEKADDIAERREAFRRLVQTTFDRERITGIDPEEVLNGRFQRCLDIYLHILKRRIKEA